MLVNEHEGNENKHEDKWQQQQHPSNARGAGTTYQVENPGPKQNVDGLDDKDHCRVADVACEITDAVLIDHADILVKEDDQGNGRDDQVDVRRGTQITQTGDHYRRVKR